MFSAFDPVLANETICIRGHISIKQTPGSPGVWSSALEWGLLLPRPPSRLT
ncbi:hypothetical protein XACM_3163 [Xanthomonas euvesicatoria pv. citrumelo F1]|nr:hypothetical protein XACM_3163 [Xanthomonas euvesicatoria pv. citrumelo F1]